MEFSGSCTSHKSRKTGQIRGLQAGFNESQLRRAERPSTGCLRPRRRPQSPSSAPASAGTHEAPADEGPSSQSEAESVRRH